MSGGGGGFNPISAASGAFGNALGDITGSNRTADAIGAASNAQLGQQQSDRTLAMTLAAPSDMEMQQLQQAITLNSQDITRKQKLLDSADPALIEAGHQALDLMNGKASAALAPIQSDRAQQRKSLEATLSQRLGGDFATSTAGAQALNEFDRQTSNLMATTQQQTLAQFMGYAGAAEQFGNQQANIQNSAALAQQRGNINVRAINALTGTPVNPGAAYAGDIARYAGQQQLLTAGASQLWGNSSQMMQSFGGMMGGGGGAAGAGAAPAVTGPGGAAAGTGAAGGAAGLLMVA